ncbi:helix-turn-helix transcriptional regulator [Nocardioides humilatus]|uniref:Helix-turn-helix transcriptional regulator n=1 Tax=Nocardioides humilatus TaxID=2607660 RepID=A0A5B1LBK7_9ACTN|nr:helix-turn-helix transcriptional regulator [Nocardioides humilatus]KAA1417826.1 helix-turn-helix transcriptional regulator [Nocardioides humilatus]
MTESMRTPLATYTVPRRHLQVVHGSDPRRLRPLPLWVDRLSDREIEVLHCIAAGLSTNEIAQTLFISTATVKSHIARLIAKVEVRDRLQLVIAAYRSGFVVVE